MAVDGKYPNFSQIQHFVPKLDVRTKTTQFIFKFGQFAKLNKKIDLLAILNFVAAI